MKKNNSLTVENDLVGKLVDSIFVLIDNEKTRDYVTQLIVFEKKLSHLRKKIYSEYSHEPWQSIIWCYCSLNSKQSRNPSTWVFKFQEISKFLDPNLLCKSFDGDSKKIFLAINIVLHRYARGRFLTTKGNNSYKIARRKFSLIHEPKQIDLIEIVSTITYRLNIQKEKSDSKHLFNVYKINQFSKERINSNFNKLDLKKIKPDDFNKKFKLLGIGKKYSRNILMDIRNSKTYTSHYAIDSRITSILEKFGIVNSSKMEYENIEIILENARKLLNQKIRKEMSKCSEWKMKEFDGWTFDRLLFNLYSFV